MHITTKLASAHASGRPTYSFEYFPPKTAQGVQNLYDRMDKMHSFNPSFIDITWGAGGRHSSLTCEMVKVAQSAYGLETCMHLTCTDMAQEKIDEALKEAYGSGCTNILALRGDPPREKTGEGEAFRYAKDLIAYIKNKYGDHFDIGVAGYPEGCDEETDADAHIPYLKEKVDAGGTFIVTQMCYDADVFIAWVKKCREAGIPDTVPILPGVMPIQTYDSLLRRANWTQCKIPADWLKQLEPIKNDDAAVRELGKDLVAEFCRRLLDSGTTMHLHFYTMNLAASTRMVLDALSVTPAPETHNPDLKPLPWRQSLGLNRRDENVRPIFWRNRKQSYVARTQDWDEFPNGRWGDARSPAFGGLDAYGIGLKGTNEHNRKLWGEPKSVQDIAQLFVGYMQGKVESLPWSEAKISEEADVLREGLIGLNRRGLLTINSQPAVDGARSSHGTYGWGPKGGYVYQKAYLEVLVHPDVLPRLVERMDGNEDITYYAVNNSGELKTNVAGDGGPNAVTWGVFPGKEIVQPTIVETVSFLAWRDEFYHLGGEWAKCYAEGSVERGVVRGLVEGWWLVNVVDNDFRRGAGEVGGIFGLFEGLGVGGVDVKVGEVEGKVEGKVGGKGEKVVNGGGKVNGNANGEVKGNGNANGEANSKANGTAHVDGEVNGKKTDAPETNGVPDGNNVVNGADEKTTKN
ncbi:methylenetetrahydrofolate reductase (NAD(P)H) met13 [Elasticomyces elasticus]|nr:methylenetetrahydrofolate reductase (NAD(P)H) met13 [Elasticomyces elasticus]